VTRLSLRESFPALPVRLDRFLKELQSRYAYDDFGVVKDLHWLVSQKLERATQHFDQAAELDPQLPDAHFEKLRLALDIGWTQEAIRLYELVRAIPLRRLRADSREAFDLDPLGAAVEATVLRVARLYHENPELVATVRKSLPPAARRASARAVPDSMRAAGEPEAIQLVRAFAATRQALIEERRETGEGWLDELYALEHQEVWNRFALAQLYRDIGWREQAEDSYRKEKTRLGPRLTFEKERYAAVIARLDQLEREIEAAKRPMVVNFQVVGNLAAVHNVRARVTLIPRPENPDAPVTAADLEIRMIPGERSEVAFRKEHTTRLVTGEVLSISEGAYTVIVEVPELPITEANVFPLRFVHQYRNTTFEESLLPGLEIAVRNGNGGGRQISLDAGAYTQSAGTLADSQGSRVSFPKGTASVRAVAELRYVSELGTIYGLHLQETSGGDR